MPRPYSADLRERVLSACESHEGTHAVIARRFRICEATLRNWLRVARAEGRRGPKPHAGGPASRLDAAACTALRELVAEQNDATLAQYADRLAARTGRRVSAPVLCQMLKRLDLRRKKRRSGRASGIVLRSPRSARPMATR
jgi:transposase